MRDEGGERIEGMGDETSGDETPGDEISGDIARGRNFADTAFSLPQRPRLHIDPTPPRRRPEPLRTSLGAVESDSKRGEDSHLGDEHARGAER